MEWWYRLSGGIYGPHALSAMIEWRDAGYFSSDMLVRRGEAAMFAPLATFEELGGGKGAAAAAAAADTAWTYVVDGKAYGPFSTAKMQSWIGRGYFHGREDEILVRAGADPDAELRPLAVVGHLFSGVDVSPHPPGSPQQAQRGAPEAPPTLSVGLDGLQSAANDTAALAAGIGAFAARVAAQFDSAAAARRSVDAEIDCLVEERELLMVERDALRSALLSSKHAR